MNAFAAGVRTLFRDPNLGTDGIFTVQGREGRPVRVLRTTETSRVGGSVSNFASQAETADAELQVSEVPDKPMKNDTLAYDGVCRPIASAKPGRAGTVWLLNLGGR